MSHQVLQSVVFLTGYEFATREGKWKHFPTCQKPCDPHSSTGGA